jgi:hypothetical protein
MVLIAGLFVVALSCGNAAEPTCTGGTTRCGAKCTSLDVDSMNCGACGAACAAGQACSSGACGVVCQPNETWCGTECARLDTDPKNCGACGHECNGASDVPVCVKGTCAPGCVANFADCDTSPDNGCETDLSTSSTSCGACGHDCHGGDCKMGVCQPAPLAPQEGHPTALAIDATNVYWLSEWGFVRSCPKKGGTPTTLAKIQGYSQNIAVDATNVYWTESGSVFACAIGGCNQTPAVLASGQKGASGITSDGVTVYWVNEVQFGQVMSCAVGGCGGAPATFASVVVWPSAITTDGKNVYWTMWWSTRFCAVGGCQNPTPLSDWGGTTIAMDATNVYATAPTGSGNGYPIWKCPLTGCNLNSTKLAPDTGDGIAVDATNVYWTRSDNGTISSCAIAGCNQTPTVIATGQSRPLSIAVDTTTIYFTSDDYKGAVMQLAK